MSEYNEVALYHAITSWDALRDVRNTSLLAKMLCQSKFINVKLQNITHIRTAHYAVFRVTDHSGDFVARIGLVDSQEYRPTNNGFLGTAQFVNHDQKYEFLAGKYLFESGAHVVNPIRYETYGATDILWLPYISDDDSQPISSTQWLELISSFKDIPAPSYLQHFNNYKKSMQRLERLPDFYAKNAQLKYETLLQELMRKASVWGIIHGDLHRQNIINHNGLLLLYDLDTVSWGPQVWDLTHLALRHGQNGNTGYSVDELRRSLGYTQEEFDIAIELRKLARDIAKKSLNL